MTEDCPPEMHPSRIVQISTAIAELAILQEIYKSSEDISSAKIAGHHPLHKDYNYSINLVDNTQPLYGPIYSKSKNQFSIIRAYIGKDLANEFMKLF